jgi:predicted transglutaminase-like cysteine proteinase
MLYRVTVCAAFVLCLLICSAAADDMTSPLPAPAVTIKSAPQLFGLDAEPTAEGPISTKWSGAEAEIHAETEVLSQCRQGAWCPPAALRFLSIVDEGRSRTGRARVGVINRAINMAIVPTSDWSQWGVEDRWSGPLETFTTGRGDCEDYAIAKYVALRAAGLAEDDVKLVVIRDTAAEEDHAVVAVRLDDGWVVLDNRWLALVHDNEIWDAIPLFVLDDSGVRQFVATASVRKAEDIASGAF